MFGGNEGLTLTRFLCFAKFTFTQGVFEDPLFLVCDTLPLEYCFPNILTMFSHHCQGSMILTLQPLKMKAACFFKTLVYTSPPVQHHIPEDQNSHTFCYCLAGLIWLWFGCIKLYVGLVELLG
jgi:hypothetical protein